MEELVRLLNEYNVRYVIIGAAAFPCHGYVRATLDTDFFIEPTAENAARTREALAAFGYDMTDITLSDLLHSKVLIRGYELETDIHPFVAGISFEEAWNDRVEMMRSDVRLIFAGLASLIAMKRAAGRQKDVEDLKYLILLQQHERLD
jgi:predicted nucleotidyltransferase